MGRKRGKAVAKIETSDPVQEIVETLLEILELSGVWKTQGGDEQAKWDAIEISLRSLAANLDHLNMAESQGADPVNTSEILLDLEEDAQDVRLWLDSLSSESLDVTTRLRLCKELENTCYEFKMWRVGPIARSLANAIRIQSTELPLVLQEIDFQISKLYSEMPAKQSTSNTVSLELRKAAAILKARCIRSDMSPWKEAKELIKEFGSGSAVLPETFVFDIPLDSDTTEAHTSLYPKDFRAIVSMGSEENIESIFEVISSFSASIDDSPTQESKCFLLLGPEGSGKTFTCDQIEKQVPSGVNVVRPSLPYDTMGMKIGSAENLLVSLVVFTKANKKPSILLLDDIESICGSTSDGTSSAPSSEQNESAKSNSGEPHITARMHSLLLTLLDAIHNTLGTPMILICTAKDDIGKPLDRFHQTFTTANPTTAERKRMLMNHMTRLRKGESNFMAEDDESSILSNLVDSTAGLSHAEFAQYCREALFAAVKNNSDPNGFLSSLKTKIQETVPESFKSGINSDFVDMKVFTPRDLQQITRASPAFGSSENNGLTLFGESMNDAWEELRRLIVMPICQANALQQMMFCDGSSGGKVFAGGVLVTGDPGCGKTALAYHCAAFASSINPAVKLLDVSCTSLIHKEVGSSERAIHRLFKSAKAAAPCILLMDGIENIAAVRGNDNTTEGTMDRVLSTLLTELDGIDSANFSQDNPACLAIIGITHNPNWIDPALRRPGRLERVVTLGLPELEARIKIAKGALSGVTLQAGDTELGSGDIMATYIAHETEGFSGASVIAVCNEAKMLASKEILTNSSTENCVYSLSTEHIKSAIEAQKAGKSMI